MGSIVNTALLDRLVGSILKSSIPSFEETLIHLQEIQNLEHNIQTALDQLPDQEREMLNLRFQKGMEYNEIAESTGKSKQTIYNQIHSAVQKLRKILTNSPTPKKGNQ